MVRRSPKLSSNQKRALLLLAARARRSGRGRRVRTLAELPAGTPLRRTGSLSKSTKRRRSKKKLTGKSTVRRKRRRVGLASRRRRKLSPRRTKEILKKLRARRSPRAGDLAGLIRSLS